MLLVEIEIHGGKLIRIDPEADPGHAAWVLQVPQGMGDLDAVVRYCVQTPEGLRRESEIDYRPIPYRNT